MPISYRAVVLAAATLFACGGGAVGALPTTAAGVAGPGAAAIPDATVRGAVERAFARDPGLADAAVHVEHGVATLSGVTRSLADARRAEATAEAVRGVRVVANRIVVTPPARSDPEIRADLEAAIARESPSALDAASVGVADGLVHLDGTVSSWATRDLLEQVAAETRGVRAIDDRLAVTGGPRRDDADLEAEVRSRLLRDAWLSDVRFAVAVTDGVVHVAGAVGSARQRTRVERDANVPGARRVDTSRVVVDPAEYDRVRVAAPPRVLGDLEVARSLGEALRADPRVGELVPRVEVVGGVATLSGVLATGTARSAAEEIARDTAGVRVVRDVTRVAYVPTRPDADVLRDAGEALRAVAGVAHPETIGLDLSHGVLVARGTIRSPFERAAVRRALVRVPGVASLVDGLALEAPPEQGARATVAERTRARIADDAELTGDRVDVEESSDGTVTLRGGVRTWGELRAATEDAIVSGAPKLVNLLAVPER